MCRTIVLNFELIPVLFYPLLHSPSLSLSQNVTSVLWPATSTAAACIIATAGNASVQRLHKRCKCARKPSVMMHHSCHPLLPRFACVACTCLHTSTMRRPSSGKAFIVARFPTIVGSHEAQTTASAEKTMNGPKYGRRRSPHRYKLLIPRAIESACVCCSTYSFGCRASFRRGVNGEERERQQ